MKNIGSILSKCMVVLFRILVRHRKFTLSVCSVYIVTFVVVLPLVCMEMPYSVYFDPGVSRTELEDRVKEINNDRVKLADAYITSLNAMNAQRYYSLNKTVPLATATGYKADQHMQKQHIDIVIAVVTVKRTSKETQRLGYLSQVVAGLDAELRGPGCAFPESSTTMFICDVHAGPGLHQEAGRLAQYFPTKTRFTKPEPAYVIMDRHDKEKSDYVYCLNEALRYDPRYVIMVEDDAVPRNNMMYTLKHILNSRLTSSQSTSSVFKDLPSHEENHVLTSNNWAYLKLFYPEVWQGYSKEWRTVIDLIGPALSGGSLFVVIFYFTLPQRYSQHAKHKHSCHHENINDYSTPHKNSNMSYISIICSFLIGATYMVVLAVLLGRQNVISWRRLLPTLHHVVPAPNCCSPAILFPASMARQLTGYLENTTCSKRFPMDFALDKFAVQHSYQRYLVEPNIMKHIGFVSSLSSKSKNPEDFLT